MFQYVHKGALEVCISSIIFIYSHLLASPLKKTSCVYHRHVWLSSAATIFKCLFDEQRGLLFTAGGA